MTKKFKRSEASRVTMTQLMLPSHANFSGKIHGGFVLSLMDQIAFACASRHSGYYCVTASVNKVDFMNPIEVGELLTLKASVNYTGNTSMVIGLRVVSENIQTGEIKHCNSSYFTMVAKDEHGKSTPVPGLILDSVESIRRYTRAIQRMEHAAEQRSQFKDTEFDVKEYLHLLEERNAKLNFDLSDLDDVDYMDLV